MKSKLLFSLWLGCVSLSQAATVTYTWTNGAGNNVWSNSKNWDLNNTCFPQGDTDIAIIGDNKGTINVENSKYFFRMNTLTIGSGSTVSIVGAGGPEGSGIEKSSILVDTINLSGKLISTSAWHKGWDKDTVINYGSITGNNVIDLSASNEMWSNGKTLTLNGALTLASGSAMSYELFAYGTIRSNNADFVFNTTGISVDSLTKQGTKLTQATQGTTYDNLQEGQFSVINDNHHVKVIYKDFAGAAIPEPTTVTLSLLGLATLMLRRRRD
ncbi:MAG: PEP-CTERM sorting domain-containing protein [Akkermansia sp.]